MKLVGDDVLRDTMNLMGYGSSDLVSGEVEITETTDDQRICASNASTRNPWGGEICRCVQ